MNITINVIADQHGITLLKTTTNHNDNIITKEKVEKEKFLGAYKIQYKQQCQKCGKYGHKPGDKRCPDNKYEKEKNMRKLKKMTIKTENLMGYATIAGEKGHMSKDCCERKYSNSNKKFEKA